MKGCVELKVKEVLKKIIEADPDFEWESFERIASEWNKFTYEQIEKEKGGDSKC